MAGQGADHAAQLDRQIPGGRDPISPGGRKERSHQGLYHPSGYGLRRDVSIHCAGASPGPGTLPGQGGRKRRQELYPGDEEN